MSTTAALRVEAVGRGYAERKRFWRAGLAPYAGDPHFVVPLFADTSARWDPRHPLFQHAETQHFLAVRDGVDVGRVAATVDHRQDEIYGDRTGLFGWFETGSEQGVAHALLDAAAGWLRERGCERVRGPLSYTTNGISGLLVTDDRPGPPVIDMPYNPPWYAEYLTSWGLEKARDLLAFRVPLGADNPIDERVARVVDRIVRRGRYRIRPIRTDRAGFAEDVDHVLRIYNGAWERNWGFVPMTPDELRHDAKTLRSVLVPELLLFAEAEGRPVGFSLTLPDMNQALAHIRGRLWPWSVLTLLRRRRRISRVRMLTLGVLPPWRRTGIEAALIHQSIVTATRLGYREGESSWILEDNRLIIRAIERSGGRQYRRYRLYERDL